ncbi:MAG: type III polyketide synthase [Planctomycetes bacterium]|nr:type III polyketide synthase [Planctomycetota bacterium]
MKIAAVASAMPEHYYDQPTLKRYLREVVWRDAPALLRRLDSLHDHVQVDGRHLAYPLERYAEFSTFGDFNDAWIAAATDLAQRALETALERADLAPGDVDAVIFTTVTGLASPSIDAKLMNRLPLRRDVKRMPLFGLGCVAGASAVSRAADFVRGDPRAVVAVISVELCSLTVQRGDHGIANVIATGLFGDGACCALVVGEQREARGPEIVATRSVFYPDTEEVMGWRISEKGFSLVLSSAVPTVARERLGPDVDAFLASLQLTRRDIGSWVCHPGGPKVLEGARDSLGLTDDDLALSWESLRKVGNLSSASVLLILEQTLLRRRPLPGKLGVMLAMGPGFCSELLLLRW